MAKSAGTWFSSRGTSQRPNCWSPDLLPPLQPELLSSGQWAVVGLNGDRAAG